MGVSGNSNAGKSFQSFAVSEDLLAKVVEAVKVGEKSARSSGDIQSFEVFYKGFRQNIAIGRIYVIPPAVCSNKGGRKFPTALLYGCLVKTFGNGEEVGDMVEQRIGDTEFDEYSQADYDTIKEKLFGTGGGKFASLILFAPMWWNKREYIAFHYTDDQAKLSNNLRHQVFAAYYDPRLSSAFDAIVTNVNTTKVDVTDITPKIPFPFLAENMLKQYPALQKQGSAKKKVFLTRRTADEVTQEVLDPQELDVFESLDQALGEAMMPGTKTVEEAGEASEGGFTSPDASNEVPRLAAEGEKKADASNPVLDPAKFPKKPEQRWQDVRPEDKTDIELLRGTPNWTRGMQASQQAWDVFLNGKKINTVFFNYKADGGAPITADDVKESLVNHDGYASGIIVKKGSIVWEDKEPKEKEACAAHEAPFTNVGPGTEAADAQAKMVDGVKENVELRAGEPPIGIAIDENGVPRSEAEQQKAARTAKNPATNRQDVSHPETLRVGTERLSSSYSAAYNGGFVDRHAMPPKEVRSYITERMGSNSEYAPHAAADHQRQIEAGAYGETPFDRRAQEKWGSAKIEVNFTGKTASDKADFIAEHIAHDFIEPHEGMSLKAKSARDAREAKLGKLRGKQADVALDIDSIWADITEEMGPAPVIEIPGEGKPQGDGRPRKSDIGGLPEAMTSDKPEKEKEISDSDAQAQEKDLENEKTKSEEPGEEAWHADAKTADFVDDAIGDVDDDDIDETWIRAAEQAIEDGSEVIYDVAANVGQIVDNVKHMDWFIKAVARELEGTHLEENAREEGRAQSEGFVTELGDQIGEKESSQHVADNYHQKHDKCSKCGKALAADASLLETTTGVCNECRGKESQQRGERFKKREANAVQPDVSEAKSEVVSPDTVDADIKQETKSVAEAAKVAKSEYRGWRISYAAGIFKATKDGVSLSGRSEKELTGLIDQKIKDTKEYRDSKKASLLFLLLELQKVADEMYPGIEVKNLDSEQQRAVEAELQKRRGIQEVKQADAVQGDVLGAKSEVVSPDTVDKGIKQPTESVAEAAKVADGNEEKQPPPLAALGEIAGAAEELAPLLAGKHAYTLTNEGQANATCPKCGGQIKDGEMVNWTSSGQEAHINCPFRPGQTNIMRPPAQQQRPGAVSASDKQAAAGDDCPEAAEFNFGEGDLAGIVLTEDEDGAAS